MAASFSRGGVAVLRCCSGTCSGPPIDSPSGWPRCHCSPGEMKPPTRFPSTSSARLQAGPRAQRTRSCATIGANRLRAPRCSGRAYFASSRTRLAASRSCGRRSDRPRHRPSPQAPGWPEPRVARHCNALIRRIPLVTAPVAATCHAKNTASPCKLRRPPWRSWILKRCQSSRRRSTRSQCPYSELGTGTFRP
jgi:hypothetical protein